MKFLTNEFNDKTNAHVLICALLAMPVLALVHILIEYRFSGLYPVPLLVSGFNANDLTWVGVFQYHFMKLDSISAIASIFFIPLFLAARRISPATLLIDFTNSNRKILTILFFILLTICAYFIGKTHALSLDEYAALFQSGVFAEMKLSWWYDPDLLNRYIPFGFWNKFLAVNYQTGQVSSIYWPGFALLLTPFTKLGVPWVLNPLIATLSLLLIFDLTFKITGDKKSGVWAVLFAAVSSAFFVTSMTYFSMSAHLFLNLLFVRLLLQATPAAFLAAGLVGAAALNLHNPYPHILFALPWGISIMRGKLVERAKISYLAAGYLAIGVVGGVAWYLYIKGFSLPVVINENEVPSPLSLSEKINQFGFMLPDLKVAGYRLIGLFKLWLWAVPGLPLLAIYGFAKYKNNRVVYLLGMSAISTFLGFLFVGFDQGFGWGYRYFHSAWGVLPVLAGVLLVPGRLALHGQTANMDLSRICAGLIFFSALVLLPLQVMQFGSYVDWHRSQRLSAPDRGHYVVLVSGKMYVHSMDLVQNFPHPRVTYLVSKGIDNDKFVMSKWFPGSLLIRHDKRGSLWSLPDARDEATHAR